MTVLQNAFDPEQVQKPSAPRVGVYLKARGQRIFVAAVLQGSPASLVGILAGDEVISIQGKRPQVDPEAFTKGASQWVIRRHPPHLMSLTVPAPGGKTIDDLISQHISLSTRKIVRKAGSSTSNLIYAHLASTHRTRFLADFKGAVGPILEDEGPLRPKPPSEAHKISGLIIDLRGPFGPVGASFAELLGEPHWFFGTDPQKPLRPVAVLVDETTLGGREWLAWMLKLKVGAKLVGSHTGGMWASSQWLPLKTCPGFLLVPQGPVKAPLPEGIGLTPDVEVPPSMVYMSGADPVLETAMGVLGSP
jgi:C-terminal processing protease CtpA/Prc